MEYIASKTAEERPETIRGPLSERAQFIIDKHREEVKDCRLHPFISQQYNEAIKEIFESAGITRLVTRLNPTTGIEKIVNGFKADGLTPPTFSIEPGGVTVHISREKFVAINLGGSSLPWGRNPDEDDRRFAYRCIMQAHKMLKPIQPKRGMGGRR